MNKEDLQKLYPETPPDYFKDKQSGVVFGKGKTVSFEGPFPYVKLRDLNESHPKDSSTEDLPTKRAIEIGLTGKF